MLDWFALLEFWQPKGGKQQKCIEGIKEGVEKLRQRVTQKRMVSELGFSRVLPKSCQLTLCIASVFLFLAAQSYHINWFPVESLNLVRPSSLWPPHIRPPTLRNKSKNAAWLLVHLKMVYFRFNGGFNSEACFKLHQHQPAPSKRVSSSFAHLLAYLFI